MRITIVQGPFLPVPPLRGGAIEKMFFPLGAYWAQRGHTVNHISRAYPGLPPKEIINGVRHLRVASAESYGNGVVDKFFDFLYALRVLKLLPRADVLITHTFFLPILAKNPQHHGEVYVHAARFPKGQLGLYSNAARIQFPSSAVLCAALKQAPQLKDVFSVIPNALPLMPESPRIHSTPIAPYRLLYTGRIHPEKGLHLLLESIALLPETLQKDIVLRIVGPHETKEGGAGGDYLSQLKALARKTSAIVEFPGAIFDPTKLAAEYVAADLFVYPSLAETGESFGVSPLEALSHGTPVLVSALECFNDFIAPGVNGFIFNHRAPGAPKELALILENILSAPGIFPALSAAGVFTAQKFTLENIGDLFINDFDKILQAKK